MLRLEDGAPERTIAGEERPVVPNGRIVTTQERYDTGLLTFVLKPRHPGYERLQEEWQPAQGIQSPDEARASIHAKLPELREQVSAWRAEEVILAEAVSRASGIGALPDQLS